jgi:hypothetical protein
MTSIHAKVTAVWLLVLTVSPFTPPFSTCDLPTLLLGTAEESTGRSTERAVTEVPAGALLSPVLPLARAAGRIRLVALSGPLAAQAVLEGALVEVILPAPGRAGTELSSRAVLRI